MFSKRNILIVICSSSGEISSMEYDINGEIKQKNSIAIADKSTFGVRCGSKSMIIR